MDCSGSLAYVYGIENLPIIHSELRGGEDFVNLQGAMKCHQGRQIISLRGQSARCLISDFLVL